jgi:hypothetical protein
MKYCTAKKISTQNCYNNQWQVVSRHRTFPLAIKRVDVGGYTSSRGITIVRVFEIADDIIRGESINDNGKRWEA